jgi:hypothetical protein
MKQDDDDNDMVDEETALKRQLAAACAAIQHAHGEDMSLLVMVFGANDGETMTVFGIEGIDVGAILEAAAAQQWGPTPDQPLLGS